MPTTRAMSRRRNSLRLSSTGRRLSETQVVAMVPVGVVTSASPDFHEEEVVEEEEVVVEAEKEKEEEEEEGDDDSILQLDAFDVPDPRAFPDLERIIVSDWSIDLPRKGIMKWIKAIHQRSRGLDLGSLGHGVLPSVFREQSAKWEIIAKQYLSKIVLFVHRFILAALEVVCADTQVLQLVSSAIMVELCAKYEDGMNQAAFLVNVERQLKPYTLNHYFNHNQQRSHGARIKETLRPKARHETHNTSWGRRNMLVINLSDAADAVTNKSNAAHATETIHDTLEAYYKVAYKRFVDNVFSQAVDYKLLSGPKSPLRLFSEQWILSLDAKKLFVVAGESRLTRERRERLKNVSQDLEVAMEILR